MWKERNQGKDPKAEGHLVQRLPVPGKGMQEMVILRKLPEGEYDMDLNVDTGIAMTQHMDDGTRTLRAGQQQATFESMAQGITGNIVGKGAKVLPQNPEPFASEEVGTHAEADGEAAAAEANSESEGEVDDVKDESLALNDLGSSILGMLFPSESQAQAAGSSGSAGPSATGKTTKTAAKPAMKNKAADKASRKVVASSSLGTTSSLPVTPPRAGKVPAAQAAAVPADDAGSEDWSADGSKT